MAWRIVKQPNGLFARFSSIVDDFTHFDATKEEIFNLCRDSAGVEVAETKIKAAEENPQRFDDEIKIIEFVHGPEHADKIRALLSKNLNKG